MLKLIIDWLILIIGFVLAIPVVFIILVLIGAFIMLYPIYIVVFYYRNKIIPNPMVKIKSIFNWYNYV